MSPARKYAQLPRTGRAEVARLVREEGIQPPRAIDLIFDEYEKERENDWEEFRNVVNNGARTWTDET